MEEYLELNDILKEVNQLTNKFTNLKHITCEEGIVIKGYLCFQTKINKIVIKDKFNLKIVVPYNYPEKLPQVKEIDNKITKDFHTNGDETLCLEAPIKLRIIFNENSTLLGFVEQAIIPYLASYQLNLSQGKLPFGERAHGGKGIIQCYEELLSVNGDLKVLKFLYLLSTKEYNKRISCPCGSNKRFNGCHKKVLSRICKYQTLEDFYQEYIQVAFYFLYNKIDIPKDFLNDRIYADLKKLGETNEEK